MINPELYDRGQESLSEILVRHTGAYMISGVYQSWISVVDRYFGETDNPEQARLSAFAVSELPLAALIRRDQDRRYPGAHSYFLIKVNPFSGERVKYGDLGTEPIIVTFADEVGNVVHREDRPLDLPYTQDHINLVVHHAHELESAGFSFQGSLLSDRSDYIFRR